VTSIVSSRRGNGCACGHRSCRQIRSWEIEPGKTAKPPKGTTHVVLDTPAGLHGKALDTVVKQVNRVIVPVQPSLFDILATGHFLETLLAEKAMRNEQAFVAVVGMRVDPRTRSAAELERFLAQVRPAGAHPSAQYAALRADNDARDDHVRPFGVACSEGSRAVAGDHRLGEQLAHRLPDRSGSGQQFSSATAQRLPAA
jgi:hypothetical protein